MGERRKSGPSSESLNELPVLLATLGEDLATLIDSKLGLLKVEIKRDATAYVRGALAFAVGGVVAMVGFVLLNVALALLLSQAFVSMNLDTPVRFAVGFLFLGATYLMVGIGLAMRAERRVAAVKPSATTSLRELEKDRKWLATEKGDR